MAKRNYQSSLYPLRPRGSEILLQFGDNECTTLDRIKVIASSLFVVGGVFWVPALYAWAVKKFRTIPKDQRKRRAMYAAFIAAATALMIAGPHRTPRFGQWINVRRWKLWDTWCRFFALEIVADQGYASVKDAIDNQAIVAVSPHGVFPFSLVWAAVGPAEEILGRLRVVVASATAGVPWVRDVLRWINAVDASKHAVNTALARGDRIGVVPGGIAEMFEGYPKPGTHPDEEYAIIRKGIFKMAIQHGVPVLPVYCFGGSKITRRLQLPSFIEKLSLIFRTSLVVLYGQWGLPIPFRQKLLYVLGRPIYPEPSQHMGHDRTLISKNLDGQVEEMLQKYIAEMLRIFDRQKDSYGWAHKKLRIIQR